MPRAGRAKVGRPRPVRALAIVLAAGASSRMGRPKPLVPWEGRPFLAHVLDALRGSGVVGVRVVVGDRAAEIRRAVPAGEARVVENPQFAQGMSSSIRAGLRAWPSRATHALIVLADQPFVQATTIAALLARAGSGDGRIFLPTFRGVRGNPVLFEASLAGEAQRIRGDVGCRAMFPDHPREIREVPVDDPGILIDVDTPEELAALAAARAAGTPLTAALERLAGPRLALHARPSERPAPRRIWRPGTDPARPAGGSPGPDRPTLLVVGASPVAATLAALGPVLGFRVVLAAPGADPRELPEVARWLPRLASLPSELGPDTYAVVASVGAYDEAALARLVAQPLPYLGLVAGAKRAAGVLAALRADGVPAERIGRIRTPVGLALNAETPEEIALSILAEIVKVRRSPPP